jgi:nitrogenase molybdenum-iron protein alpha/beta subunit
MHEELDLPIVPIYTTGFSTQNAVSGYDTALHALLKYLSGKNSTAGKNASVNLLSVAEHPLDRKEAHDLLEGLGLALNVLPDNSTVASFRAAISARASIPLCPDAPEYLGTILKEKYGVPFIDAPRPVGIEGTGRWLKSIGAALDISTAAEELHIRKAAETLQQLGDFSLSGKKVYLSLSSANAFSLITLVEELGGEVAGVTVTHLDRLHVRYLNELAVRNPALQIHVSDGQEFEEISILRKLSLDLYLGDSTHIGQVARLGIPTVSLENLAIVGYSGVVRLSRRIKTALANRSFGTSLTRSIPPYRESWYRRSNNWHIKQEVK